MNYREPVVLLGLVAHKALLILSVSLCVKVVVVMSPAIVIRVGLGQQALDAHA